MTITEFLLARIADEEELARLTMENVEYVCAAEADRWGVEQGHSCCDCGSGFAVQVGPDRVLAECAAKRAIIELAGKLHDEITGEWGGGQTWQKDGWQDWTDATTIVRTLAAVYASHPDYQEEWKP